MKAILIQSTKIDDNNHAERQILEFLRDLPEGCVVYRELRLTPEDFEQRRGVTARRPDFVVVSPEAGLVSIEVKDWNLARNTYVWVDQETVRRTGVDGFSEDITNPFSQAETYFHGLIKLLGRERLAMTVTSLVAFPRITREQFLNHIEKGGALRNSQAQFLFDPQRTLFRNDLDEHFSDPHRLLLNRVRRSPRYKRPDAWTVDAVNRLLIPPKFAIGDLNDVTARQAGRRALRVLSEAQQQWVFGLDSGLNYLLDVAGSGKTNALVSKAIHLVDQKPNERQRILITTYSDTLARNIDSILRSKLGGKPTRDQHVRESVYVESMPSLMKRFVCKAYGISTEDYARREGETEETFEQRLRRDAMDVLGAESQRFRVFDAVFVDEVQDFDDAYLRICKALCRSDRFFFVGDIGQRIYDRRHDLAASGFPLHNVDLEKTYRMYRTPSYVSQLATAFAWSDPHLAHEFEQRGYRERPQPASPVHNAAVTERVSDPVLATVDLIGTLTSHTYSESDCMVISVAAKLPDYAAALARAGIRSRRADEPDAQGVILTDFVHVKGLEAYVVIVTEIESLYECSQPPALFDDESRRAHEQQRSRRLVYVALTRTVEQLYVYYTDPHNAFVASLLAHNRAITAERQCSQLSPGNHRT